MDRIAMFERVSYERFFCDFCKNFTWKSYELGSQKIEEIYHKIKLPERKTSGSAGYDFHIPVGIVLQPKTEITIPTGVRCKIFDGYYLQIVPRSSLGFKYKLQLSNTVGIIDSDFYYTENEGHIFAKLFNDGDEIVRLEAGDSFMQGIFVPFGITTDDNTKTKRTGGIGSTNSKGEINVD